VNVSLPNVAARPTPAMTSPGAATISTKFSTALAQAQDTSLPKVMSAGEKQTPKPMTAKSEKSTAKPTDSQARSLSKAAFIIDPVAPEGKVALSDILPFGAVISPSQVPQADDSDADTQSDGLSSTNSGSNVVPAFPVQLALGDSGIFAGPAANAKSSSDAAALSYPSGAVGSSQLGPKKTDSPEPKADNQPVEVSSTNLLGTWASAEENTNFKALVIPGAGNSETPASPNGKPANAAGKPASREAAISTNAASDSKSQTGIDFLQSHAALSTTTVASRPDMSKGQQEKAVASASAETNKSEIHKKDFDVAGDEATGPGSGNSSLPGTTLAGSNSGAPANTLGAGTTASTATMPGSSDSTQVSTPVAVNPANTPATSPKTTSAPSATAATEDAEAATEAAAVSANSPIHAARLVAGIEQSELRVGLRSGEFGNVDIRTSLVRNQFTAEISVERGELGRVLAAELPSLQHRLSEQHLSAADITVQHHSSGGSSEFQQGSRQGDRAVPVNSSGDRESQGGSMPVLPVEHMETTARLDIHM
jgi:flagellar hook-length control protein FliK